MAGGLSIAPHHLWTKRAPDILSAKQATYLKQLRQFKTGQESLSLCSANRRQEASERFLASSKGSLMSTQVFDHQPRFLNSQEDLKQLPSLTFINLSWFPLPIPDLYEVTPSLITTRSRTLLNLVLFPKRLHL